MEGYSVTEAASVLGVPTERVWELLARGILSGAPEGETGMRVFLQPRPAAAPPDAVRPNGDGADREPQRELSPFRELLTEFRNLTERYGQALLALGEARGEVASLRSRVDVLEARMDLRLPGGAVSGPSPGWTQPTTPAPRPAAAPETPSAGAARPATLGEERAGSEVEHRIRRDSPRRATESFAEALARAEDPSVPELPGGPEAAAALSALRAAPVDEAAQPEAALPRELPPADEVPVADEVSVADEVAVADEAPPADEVPVADEVSVADEAAGPAAVPTAEARVLEEAPIVDEVGMSEEPPAVTADEATTAEAGQTPLPAADAEATGAEEVEPAVPDDGPAWQDDRYTAEIGEPDWWEPTDAEAASHEPAPEPEAPEALEEPGAPEAPQASEALAPEAPTEPAPEVAQDAAGAEAAEADIADLPPTRPPSGPPVGSQRATLTRLRATAPRHDEETVMWFGRSPDAPSPEGSTGDADEMEIAPTGRASTEAPDAGARQLDDALAALDALSRATPSQRGAQPEPESAEAQLEPESPAAQQPQPDSSARPENREPQSQPMPRSVPPAHPVPPTPAGRAYRRLRRIFPS